MAETVLSSLRLVLNAKGELALVLDRIQTTITTTATIALRSHWIIHALNKSHCILIAKRTFKLI